MASSPTGDHGQIGHGPDVGREGPGVVSAMGVAALRGPRKETVKLPCCVGGGKQFAEVLELRQPWGPRAGGRVLLPALPGVAAAGPDSRLLQPHGLVRRAVSGRERRPRLTCVRGAPVGLRRGKAWLLR